jgi:hypothetical protein
MGVNAGQYVGGNMRKRQTIEKWIDKGWTPITIDMGEQRSDEITFEPTLEDLHVLGHFFDDDDEELKGRKKPHHRVDHTDDGAVIVFSRPLQQPITALYKIEPDDDTDPEEINT